MFLSFMNMPRNLTMKLGVGCLYCLDYSTVLNSCFFRVLKICGCVPKEYCWTPSPTQKLQAAYLVGCICEVFKVLEVNASQGLEPRNVISEGWAAGFPGKYSLRFSPLCWSLEINHGSDRVVLLSVLPSKPTSAVDIHHHFGDTKWGNSYSPYSV